MREEPKKNNQQFLDELAEIDKRISELETLKQLEKKLVATNQQLKASEKEIKYAHTELNQIFNSAADGMCVINKDFHILRTNETFLNSMQSDDEKILVGEKCHQVLAEQFCHTEGCPLRQIINGKESVEYESCKQDENGNKKYYIVTATPFKGFDGQLIGIVKNYRDITEHKLVLEKLRLSSEKFRKALAGTIDALKVTVERRDPYTAGHQEHVASLGSNIAREMGLPKDTVDSIFFAGTIHDLGKISVPIEILCKPGKITKYEFDIIKIHPQIGYEILHPIEFPWPIAQIVLQHHERLNGSGYPLGIGEKNMLLEAKILCVADVVEAVANHRPYRPSLGIDRALREISKNKGILYDSQVVETCLKIFRKQRFHFE